MLDTPTLRILDIQIPPGDQTLFHTHDTAILYVPIARSQTRGQDWGGAWSGGGAAAAPATPAAAAPAPAPARPQRVNSVTTYVETPYTHRVNNIGTSLFRLIGIANRTAGDTAPPAAGGPAPELENRYYRAERLVVAPGASLPVSTHNGPVVLVMQTPGTAAVDGASWQPLNGPGDFARIDGAVAHRLHNRGAAEIEVVAVAVKGAR
jgi:quercetin dioxygenase-like cupin family protein